MTRSILDMSNIQIEITSSCINQCSNCTRFVGHVKSFFMDIDTFKQAVDSMTGYPNMVGMQGGEPILHPLFEEMCNYLHSKFPPEQCGLWTTFPKGYEHYRHTIVETFGNIFLNDHTRDDIYHQPALVAIDEVVLDKNVMWACIDHCWAQEGWSASINPRGAFFCEMAASFAMLFPNEDSKAWPVEPGWWWRTPKDFTEQMEKWCPRCGMAAPLQRRASIECIDDISQGNFDRLMKQGSTFKIAKGLYKIHDPLDICSTNNQLPLAAYKDFEYRNNIAKRYGMFLICPNDKGYWTPYLYKDFKI